MPTRCFTPARAPTANLSTEFPVPGDQGRAGRGEQRYNIYCTPCHDRTGNGNGMIVRRGYRRPPSYHSDRLRQQPNGYFFDVITNGFGAMPDYAAQIQPRDRWAIVAYIRALQFSQQASINDVPAGARGQLGGAQMMANAVDYSITPQLQADIRQWRTRALIAGVLGSVVSAAGFFIAGPTQFYRSYLWSFMFIVALTLGPLAGSCCSTSPAAPGAW